MHRMKHAYIRYPKIFVSSPWMPLKLKSGRIFEQYKTLGCLQRAYHGWLYLVPFRLQQGKKYSFWTKRKTKKHRRGVLHQNFDLNNQSCYGCLIVWGKQNSLLLCKVWLPFRLHVNNMERWNMCFVPNYEYKPCTENIEKSCFDVISCNKLLLARFTKL